jgi:hypothetical protein
MLVLVRTFQRFTPLANLDRLIATHAPDASGHCPLCRTVGCTIRSAARDARHAGKPAR